MKKLCLILLTALVLLQTVFFSVSAGEQYDNMTDEELYAWIDEQLARDRVPGEVIVTFAEGVEEEQALDILRSAGLAADAEPENVVSDSQFVWWLVTVSEDIIRPFMFYLCCHEAVSRVTVNEIVYEEPCLMGDVNNDGEVDAKDYIMVKRHVLQTHTLSIVEMSLADVDADGEVTARDYMILKMVVLGKCEQYEMPGLKDL